MALPKLGSLPEASQLEIAEELGFDGIEEMAYSMGLTVAKLRRRAVKPIYKLAPELEAWEQLGITSEQAWALSNKIQAWRANGEAVNIIQLPHYGKHTKHEYELDKQQTQEDLERTLSHRWTHEDPAMQATLDEQQAEYIAKLQERIAGRSTLGTWLVCKIQRIKPTAPLTSYWPTPDTRRYFWHWRLKHPRWYAGFTR